MKIDVMRQPLSLTLVMFGLLAVLFCARVVSWPFPEEFTAGTELPVESLITGFGVRFRVLSLVISMLMVFYNGLALSRILSRHMVFTSRTYTPITIYLVVSCGIWFAGANLAAVVASLFLVRATECFLASFVRHTTFDTTFKGALFLGIAPLIYPPATIYIIIIPIGLALLKRTGREIITAIIGGVIPVMIYAYVMWMMDQGFFQSFISFGDRIMTPAVLPTIELGEYVDIIRLICSGLIIILTLTGLTGFTLFSGKMRTRARTIFVYFFILLVIGCVSVFIPAVSISDLMMLAVPIAIIIPAAFAHFPGWLCGSMYILLMLTVTALNVYPFLLT